MKQLHITILLSLLMSMGVNRSFAYDYTDGTFFYNYSHDPRYGGVFVVSDMDANYSGDVVIPDHIDNLPIVGIGPYAFAGFPITSIIIPNTVKFISSSAFVGCSELASIIIPNSVIDIDSNVFESTPWYDNQPDGLVYAGQVAYKYKGTMPNNTIIALREGTTGIAGSAFNGHSGLTSISIPQSVTFIGSSVFAGCNNLTSVTVKWIEPPSFYEHPLEGGPFSNWNSSNATLYVPVGSKEAYEASWGRLFKEVVEGGGLSTIAFADTHVKALCVDNWDTNGDGLTEEELAAVTDLGYVFTGNETITSFNELQFFTGLTSIGDCAFNSCSSLTSIIIPSSVTSIVDYAFGGCSALNSIDIPDGMACIGDGAFIACNSLTSINIPSSVASIGEEAFMECTSLTSIEIPSNVTNVGDRAFSGCTSLTSVTNHSNVITIGNGTFEFCSNLASIEIPSGVTSIGDGVFAGCDNLTSVTIPRGVTSIGEYAFDCINLTSVTVEWGEPITITCDAFPYQANATLYVPAGSKTAYEADDYWKEFKEIVELEAQKFALEISVSDGAFKTESSHLYDRDGNEYGVTDFSNNEFVAGSYIRIVPSIIPHNVYYISEIIVNGESVGTWTDEHTAPTEYVIESLSGNTTVEFKTYYIENYRTLGCVANGPGNVEMYRNGNYVGTTITENPYDTHIKLITEVFEVGDVLKLVFVPDEGSTLTGFSGGPNDSGVEDVDLLADVADNTYTITFPYNYHDDYPLLRCFTATFEGLEPQTDNTLSATSTTILTGKEASQSLSLTNEDEIIMTEFYMQLPDGITIEEDEDGYPIVTINSERENKHVIEVSRNSEGLYHFLCYSSKNNAFKGNEGELFSMNLICAEGVAAGTYTATVRNIIMSDVDRNELTQSDFTFDITVLDVAMGDANGDGRINGMDIVEMVDYIMERPSNSFVFAAADLIGDGKVNGMDLVELVSLVMAQVATQAAPPSALPRREGTLHTEKLDMGTLALKRNEDGGVMLGVEDPDEFILAQMVVEVSDGTLTDVTTDNAHVATWTPIGENRYSVLAYSMRNRLFTTNDCLLTFLGCEGNVTVKDVMLVDADREARFFADVTYNGTTGIVPTPNPSLKRRESIYDLSGRKLETRNMKLGTSPKGVYIVNGKKVVVK